LNERNQDWIDAYMHPFDKIPELWLVCPEGPDGAPRLTDEEYLVYGDGQIPGAFRAEYLQTALEISDRGDSAILLLNPQILSKDGEWEAWRFANWLPGAKRYRRENTSHFYRFEISYNNSPSAAADRPRDWR
jgi:hypothetical protein